MKRIDRQSLEKLKQLYFKYREYILYLVFGGLTTVVNYVVYLLLTKLFHVDIVAANTIAWIAAVAFAYVTNRIWVFESKAGGSAVFREIGEFVLGRLFTLLLEDAMLWLFAERLGFNDIVIKIIASIVTIVLNYVFSKFIIFRKDKAKKE